MKLRYTILAFFACILIAFSCKDKSTSPDPDPNPPENPNVASQDIGPDGGEITSKDGKLTLTIPAGALDNTETITIEKITEDDLGPEFGELVDALGFENGWELGPDGLQFNQPVTASFQTNQTPTPTADSLGVFAEFFFISDGETLEALDSLRVDTDVENNTITVSGQLSHFSQLFEPVQVSNGVFFSVRGVPDMLEVGGDFKADVVISTTSEGALGGLTTLVGPARYLDSADAPLVASFEGAPNVDIPLDENNPDQAGDRYRGKFGYTCTEDGPALFFTEMRVGVRFDLDSGPITAETFSFFARPVECVESEVIQVALEGEGSGSVTSDPPGINCPDGDCEKLYAEGAMVTLTATADEVSIFTGWSGEAPDECTTDDNCLITVSESQNEITATFEPKGVGGLGLGVVLNDLSKKYGINSPEALFHLLSNPFLFGGNSAANHAKFAQWSQQVQQNEVQFGDLTGTFPVAMAGAEGFVVIDLLDGEVLLDETDINNTGDLFGVVGATQEPPGTDSDAMLFAFGTNDHVLHRNSTGGSFNNSNPIVFTNEPTFDAYPAGGNPIGADVVSYVQPNRGVRFYAWTEAQNLYVPAGSANEFDDALFEGQLVSAYIHSDEIDENGRLTGPVLVLTREAESGVYLAKRDGSNPVRAIDNIGFDARKIRCIDNGSGTGNLVCVASIFGHDRLGLLTWDGENLPTLTDFAEVGDGPVGIDLRLLSNGNIAVVSTGFNDNTVTVTVVAPNGIVQSSSTRPVLEGCQSPGHAIFIQDSESLKIVGTCYNSSNYFIMESEL